jgi:hypothetical protein
MLPFGSFAGFIHRKSKMPNHGMYLSVVTVAADDAGVKER